MSIKNFGNIGFGTFGSDKYGEDIVAEAVYLAIKSGYRIFDCASVYGNEKQIGTVFKRAFDEGLVKREDLYIISKVWNDAHDDGEVIQSCNKSIEQLGVGYLDLFFLHWPFPNYHAKGCTISSRNPDSRPFFLDDFMLAWRQMEKLKNSGLVRDIGMSNMTIPKFEAVLPQCKILPYAHEMELHPSFQQPELYEYCKERNMEILGYCPLGSPNRPLRDMAADDVVDMQLEEVATLAKSTNVHPANVCIAWAVSKGHIPIPFASREVNIANNINTARAKPYSKEQLDYLRLADRKCRLVKGHVFLWEGAEDWTDLWDIDGVLVRWKRSDNKWLKC